MTSAADPVPSSALDLSGMPLEQLPALAPVTLAPMVQRVLAGPAPAAGPLFGSCI